MHTLVGYRCYNISVYTIQAIKLVAKRHTIKAGGNSMNY